MSEIKRPTTEVGRTLFAELSAYCDSPESRKKPFVVFLKEDAHSTKLWGGTITSYTRDRIDLLAIRYLVEFRNYYVDELSVNRTTKAYEKHVQPLVDEWNEYCRSGGRLCPITAELTGFLTIGM